MKKKMNIIEVIKMGENSYLHNIADELEEIKFQLTAQTYLKMREMNLITREELEEQLRLLGLQLEGEVWD